MKVRTMVTYIVSRRDFEVAASEFFGRQYRFIWPESAHPGRQATIDTVVGSEVMMTPETQKNYDEFCMGGIAPFPHHQIVLTMMCAAGIIQPGFYSIERY